MTKHSLITALLLSLAPGVQAANPARLNLKLASLPAISRSLPLFEGVKLEAAKFTPDQLASLIATLPALPKGFNPPKDGDGDLDGAGILVPRPPTGPLPTLSAAEKLPMLGKKAGLPASKLTVHALDGLFDGRSVSDRLELESAF